MTKVKVEIENVYGDGYEQTNVVELPAPSKRHPLPADDEFDDESYWEAVVWPETGCGHYADVGSCYTATIIEAKDPELVGLTYEWVD
jgi:hypothetical protein